MAAETINGINQVLHKDNSNESISIWSLDKDWNYISHSIAENGSNAYIEAENNFELDINGDGTVGTLLSIPSREPLYSDQWHLHTADFQGANVVNAWKQANSSGKKIYGTGVLIGIVDDGLDHSHPDLSENYVPQASYDWVGGDSDPTPSGNNAHGTAAGGVAAGYGHNGIGIAGAAPNASLSGLRLLGAGTDANEAAALTHSLDAIDIYSNSWGPYDNGKVQPAGPLFLQAVANGVTNGRGGLGSIYAWAGGNGRRNKDNSNYDGWANSRYVNAIAAIANDGKFSSYSEPGANILVAAPSNGGSEGITTTDIAGNAGYASGDYIDDFGGTSSACPLFAGVVALMLDANPNLTWRDVQHVIVESADSTIDSNNPSWITNGAGYAFNHDYGFGRLDAEAAVITAKSWNNVASEVSHVVSLSPNMAIPDDGTTTLTSTINVSQDITIETIEIPFISNHTYRGDLTIELTSPQGTTTTLAVGDPINGRGDRGNYNFTFSAKTFWGESSKGDWNIAISDQYPDADSGDLNSWGINFYGTEGSNYQNGLAQQTITAKDDITGRSGLTYASKDALESVPGLSSYVNYLEETFIESDSADSIPQKWLVATESTDKRNLKAAGFQTIEKQAPLSSNAGDSFELFQADVAPSLNPSNLLDNLEAEFGSDLAFAYPDIAHDHQSRSLISTDLLV